jgi:CRP/FNR family transcriptional regulator
VAVIRVDDFWGAARRDLSLTRDAMRHVTRRLSEAHSQIESLVFDNNQRRLARALLGLSDEAARVGESSVRLTHEELAELIGSTREVVTGMMIEFRQRGLQARRHSTEPARINSFRHPLHLNYAKFLSTQARRLAMGGESFGGNV